jgi:hypothetical protein
MNLFIDVVKKTRKRHQHIKLLPPTRKNRCITKNCVDSYSNLGNGMCQMAFLGKIDIYAVKNRLIRYLWMLKIHILSIMPFSRFD